MTELLRKDFENVSDKRLGAALGGFDSFLSGLVPGDESSFEWCPIPGFDPQQVRIFLDIPLATSQPTRETAVRQLYDAIGRCGYEILGDLSGTGGIGYLAKR